MASRAGIDIQSAAIFLLAGNRALATLPSQGADSAIAQSLPNEPATLLAVSQELQSSCIAPPTPAQPHQPWNPHCRIAPLACLACLWRCGLLSMCRWTLDEGEAHPTSPAGVPF